LLRVSESDDDELDEDEDEEELVDEDEEFVDEEEEFVEDLLASLAASSFFLLQEES